MFTVKYLLTEIKRNLFMTVMNKTLNNTHLDSSRSEYLKLNEMLINSCVVFYSPFCAV